MNRIHGIRQAARQWFGNEPQIWLAIISLAIILRFAAIGQGSFHPDEKNVIRLALDMIERGSLEPARMNYGTLTTYIHAVLFFLPVKIVEWSEVAPKLPEHTAVVLARIFSACTSVATVLVTAAIGRELMVASAPPIAGWPADTASSAPPVKPRADQISAFLFAISFIAVQCGQYSTVDSPLVLWTTSSALLSLRAFQSARLRHFVCAGVLAGLATATKYTGLLSVLGLALIPLLRPVRERQWMSTLLGLSLVPITFLAAMPYAIFRFDKLRTALEFESNHYRTGGETIFAIGEHTWWWNLEFLYYTGLGPGVLLMAAFGSVWLISEAAQRARPASGGGVQEWQCMAGAHLEGIEAPESAPTQLPGAMHPLTATLSCPRPFPLTTGARALLLLAYPLIAYLFVSRYPVRFDRNLLPLVPFFCLCAGLWYDAATRALHHRMPRHTLRIMVSVLVLCSSQILMRDVIFLYQLYQPHPRTLYKQWKRSLPPEILVRDHGRIQGATLKGMVQKGVTYVAMSSHSYEPVAADPVRHSNLALEYRRIFEACDVVQVFRNPWFDSDFFSPHHLNNSATVNVYHGPTIIVLKVPGEEELRHRIASTDSPALRSIGPMMRGYRERRADRAEDGVEAQHPDRSIYIEETVPDLD